jgi:hypothetical protein
MKAFRRLLDGDLPAGSSGLNLTAVEQASRELYCLDGQISFDRADLYARILTSLSTTQRAYLDAMKGKGWASWPAITDAQIKSRMQGLPQGTAVAVMTYAGDLFSWYAGSVEADVYFCPERHGTYYGGFYIKDAPAIGHEGYSIDETLTATAGAALSDSTKGYVTTAQAAVMSSLVDTQRKNLYASSTANIVQVRTAIATLLRSLLTAAASADAVEAQVLVLSETYGALDGENNYAYARVFAQVFQSLSLDQRARLAALRHSILSGTYADSTAYDYTTCTTPYLYSSPIADAALLAPYVDDTDWLFFEPTSTTAAAASAAGGGCFIATAAFGSPLAPQVQRLRELRDRLLLPHWPGRVAVRLYYAVSPPAADAIRPSAPLRAAVRLALAPLVAWAGLALWSPALGLGVVLLPLAVLVPLRRRRRGRS